jgi:hypothetical protein
MRKWTFFGWSGARQPLRLVRKTDERRLDAASQEEVNHLRHQLDIAEDDHAIEFSGMGEREGAVIPLDLLRGYTDPSL